MDSIILKIYFEDFWTSFDVNENFITKILQKHYTLVIDKNPDYLFFSTFGYNHLKYKNCIKIFYSGENVEVDFNLSDYAISYQHLNAKDRYCRYPFYIVYMDYHAKKWQEQLKNKSFDKATDRKFCNFVYSNGKDADPIRELFFKKLSKYKKVDSGGRYLNNIGGAVTNKMEFIKDYKFTIAFENSLLSGYTTEKIIEPMIAGSMPIYWGNPDIHLDFDKNSFVCVNDFNSIDEAVDEVVRLDNDNDAYMKKIYNLPIINDINEKRKMFSEQLLIFLENIFEQDYAKAKRTTNWGFVSAYKQKQETMELLYGNKITRPLVKFFQFVTNM